MANLKSSKKDIRRIAKRNLVNSMISSKVRTLLKRARFLLISSSDPEEVNKSIIYFESNASSRKSKKIFKEGKISRQISRLRLAFKKKFQNPVSV